MIEEYTLYKGKKLHDGDGFYWDTTIRFFAGGLKNLSRCIKANHQDCAVCLLVNDREENPNS